FSVSLPAGWKKASEPSALFGATHGSTTIFSIAPVPGRGSSTMAQWAQSLAIEANGKGATGLKSQVVREPGGSAVYLAFQAANQTNAKQATIEEFYFDAGSTSYVMAFSMPSSSEPALRSDIAKIVTSFRLK
ncbi:MAG TPA: hypothetical protein VGN06_02055, partial [Gaiellaceae bacterium]